MTSAARCDDLAHENGRAGLYEAYEASSGQQDDAEGEAVEEADGGSARRGVQIACRLTQRLATAGVH